MEFDDIQAIAFRIGNSQARRLFVREPGKLHRLGGAEIAAEGSEILRFRVDAGPRGRLSQGKIG